MGKEEIEQIAKKLNLSKVKEIDLSKLKQLYPNKVTVNVNNKKAQENLEMVMNALIKKRTENSDKKIGFIKE